MRIIKLSKETRQALSEEIRVTKDVKILKRAQTLLWYDDGVSVSEICRRLESPRQTVYDWINQYKRKNKKSLEQRLSDKKQPGRPPKKKKKATKYVEKLIETSPVDFGYRYTCWTAPLLAKHIEKTKKMLVSQDTIKACLKELEYVCKRPKHTPSRQPETWRQSSGGLKKRNQKS